MWGVAGRGISAPLKLYSRLKQCFILQSGFLGAFNHPAIPKFIILTGCLAIVLRTLFMCHEPVGILPSLQMGKKT